MERNRFSRGTGSRLYPATAVMSKHLLPVFDKPMIYYPLSTLMHAGVREILIIATPQDMPRFRQLLGNGNRWGIELSFSIQPSPDGLVQAFLIGENSLRDSEVALILEDNIFYGHSLQPLLETAFARPAGATIFAYRVVAPEQYGVVELNSAMQALSIEEKPQNPKSQFTVTGLYLYDSQVVELAKTIRPSGRGELEITDLNKLYLRKRELHVEVVTRGFTWLDAGIHESLLEASQFIATIEKRQGLKVSCPEEIAFRQKWISREDLESLANSMLPSPYTRYLLQIAGDPSIH